MHTDRKLWERGYGQNDFLKLRLGLGDTLLAADISYSERKFSLDNDNLQEEMLALCEKPKVLKDIPITLSIFDNYISGVIGSRETTKLILSSFLNCWPAKPGYYYFIKVLISLKRSLFSITFVSFPMTQI
jgi:hypothetical protein